MKKDKNFWLLVANAGEAHFYRGVGPQGDLEKFHEMTNEEARMKAQDLETDSPGRVKTPTGGRAKRGETHPKDQEVEEFAVEVADFLDRARPQGKFKKLSLVAPPKFLGTLRKTLDDSTSDRVIETVSKNLVDQEVSAVQEHLEKFN